LIRFYNIPLSHKLAEIAMNDRSAGSHGWSTLPELKTVALARGCTPVQFAEAVETVGTDPFHVAQYLQRYSLLWSLPPAIQGSDKSVA
jgi:hypothetical protein